MVRSLFGPAIRLMDSFRFTAKFAVIATLSGLAFIVLLVQLGGVFQQQIRAAEWELEGLQKSRLMLDLVREVQRHRAASSGVTAGAGDLAGEREMADKAVDAAFKAVEARLTADERSAAAWQDIVKRWAQLQKDGLELTALLNFEEHTALLGALVAFLAETGDRHSLTMDPQLDSYYLIDAAVVKLPQFLETLTQIQARGTALLAKRNIGNEERALVASMQASAAHQAATLEGNFAKIVRFNPVLKERLEPGLKDFRAAVTSGLDVASGQISLGMITMGAKGFHDQVAASAATIYKFLGDPVAQTAHDLIERRLGDLRQRVLVNLLVLAAVLVLLAYVVVGAFFSITGSIGSLEAAARQMAAGDLTARVELTTRDEISIVGRSFNEMAASIASLLGRVREEALRVVAASEQLNAASDEIRVASERQNDAATSMAASVEEMAVGVEHIGKSAVEASGVTRHAGDLSAQGGRTVQTVVREIESIAESVRASAHVVGELGEHSERISAVVAVIRDIADQTNLLALNAAIEAARAGEQGRGFAVVADEVRKLAERTAASTREIATMVGNIQNGTRAAVSSMEGGVERVARGVEMTREAGSAMSEIETGAQQVIAIVDDISAALREQNVASADLAKNVEQIARMSERNTAAVARNAETASELQGLAKALQGEVERFRIA